MKIKKDGNFILYYSPKQQKVIDLIGEIKYLEKFSGKIYENFYYVYELLYDEEGQRLDSPYTPPYDLVEVKDE